MDQQFLEDIKAGKHMESIGDWEEASRISKKHPIKIPRMSEFKEERQKYIKKQKELYKVFGNCRSAGRFMVENSKKPILLEKNGWVLRYFNIRSGDTSDYILYRLEDLNQIDSWDSIPVIEFNCDNHTLKFNKFCYGTILSNIPDEVHEIISEFIGNNITSNTIPIPVKYLKRYIAVLDEVSDFMVPTLVAHSVLGAHLIWARQHLHQPTIYDEWLCESFRECVVKVDRKTFEKIKQLDVTYLGHENKTLGGEKSCAVVYPVWSDNVPNVLKFAKLWKPNNA